MKICGIEIKSNEAILAVCSVDGENVIFQNTDPKKVALKIEEQDFYREFLNVISEFMSAQEIDKVYLRKPVEKGKQISGANAFRIEALLNLLDIPIISIHPASVTKYIKKEGNAILGKNEAYAYQNGALDTLYYGIRKK